MFYEFKVKVTKDTPKGEKEVTEQYLVDCLLFAEAECAGMGLYDGAGDVVAVFRSDIKEIVNEGVEGKPFYKATIVSEFKKDDGTVKETRHKVLVAADSLQQATAKTQDYMRQGLQDMRLDKVEKTKILEIIHNP